MMNKDTDNVRACLWYVWYIHCAAYTLSMLIKTDPHRALTELEGSIEGVDRRLVTQPLYAPLCTIIHVYPERQWTLHKAECNTLEVAHGCP